MQTKWRDEVVRTWKHTFRHEHLRAKYRYLGVFMNAVFNHFPLEDFSRTNRNGACANTSRRSSTRDEESRTRIQKPRERLWVASEQAGTFLPFADTENQCLSTFDSPSFRTHNKRPTIKKINVCSCPRLQPGSRWWRKSLQMPHARMVKLRKDSPHRFIALWKHTCCSLRTLSFCLIRHKNDFVVRFRCKYPLFLFFTTCHILLFQVDLASHWTCWTETRWHAEHLYERHRLMVSGVLGRVSALCCGLPLFLIFFIEFHGKL